MNLVLPVTAKSAVAAEMKALLAFMYRLRDQPAEEQLHEIRRWIEETIRGVDDPLAAELGVTCSVP